jgi:cation:H+ antiporter
MTLVTIGLVATGLVALAVGADALVRGASRLALLCGISPLVVGLTVVALGTSAPEIAAGVAAALAGRGDLVVGNVVGSNVANVLFILGISAALSPLVARRALMRFDVPLTIALSLGAWLLVMNGRLDRGEGALLAAGLPVYLIITVRRERRAGRATRARLVRPVLSVSEAATDVARVVGGGVALALGADWLIDGATAIARAIGVSEAIVGLTVVALGTSLPELATSMIATWRGERDLAVGNIIGSNVLNLLAVLGFAGLVSPDGLAISSNLVWIDMPVMAVVATASAPVLASGGVVSRREGLALLAAGFVYLAIRLPVG